MLVWLLVIYFSFVFLEFIVCIALLYNWDKVSAKDVVAIAFVSLFLVVMPVILYNVYKGLNGD